MISPSTVTAWEPGSTRTAATRLLRTMSLAPIVRLPATATEGELRTLVGQLFATRTPLTSPAGRPTYIELNHGELARRFQK